MSTNYKLHSCSEIKIFHFNFLQMKYIMCNNATV